MIPLVYVAGPYGDVGGYINIDRNIAVAREACKWLAENGFYFLCPHMNSAHFEVITPEVTVEHWYAQDIRLLDACDAMLLVGDWGKSRGVGKEVAYAFANKMPIFDFNSEVARRDLEHLHPPDHVATNVAAEAMK